MGRLITCIEDRTSYVSSFHLIRREMLCTSRDTRFQCCCFPTITLADWQAYFHCLCKVRWLVQLHAFSHNLTPVCTLYRGTDKSLARPGRKQANVSIRMAWISLGAMPCRKRNLMTARVSILLKSRASLTFFRACFLPGRAKDLSALRYLSHTSYYLILTVCQTLCPSTSVVVFMTF